MMHSETCDTVGVGVCKICIMQNIFLGATHNKSMERRYFNIGRNVDQWFHLTPEVKSNVATKVLSYAKSWNASLEYDWYFHQTKILLEYFSFYSRLTFKILTTRELKI